LTTIAPTVVHVAEARVALELTKRLDMAPHRASEICRGLTRMDGWHAWSHLVVHTSLSEADAAAILRRHGVLK